MELDAEVTFNHHEYEYEFEASISLWNGREVELEEESLEVARWFFSQLSQDNEFLAYRLAWLGSDPSLRTLLEREIAKEVSFSIDNTWELTGFTHTCRSIQEFIREFYPQVCRGVTLASNALVRNPQIREKFLRGVCNLSMDQFVPCQMVGAGTIPFTFDQQFLFEHSLMSLFSMDQLNSLFLQHQLPVLEIPQFSPPQPFQHPPTSLQRQLRYVAISYF